MDHRTEKHTEPRHVDECAAEWLARLKSDGASDKRTFLRWLRRSPEAVGEMLLATSTDIVLHGLFKDRKVDIAQFSNASNVIRAHDQYTHAVQRFGLRWRRTWITGLSLAAASAIIAVLIIQPPFVHEQLFPNLYTTSVGEQRAVELVDGSVIAINAQSRVRVKFSEQARDVYLHGGQAMFTVAKDAARPFRVHIGQSTVQAVGTKFDVRRRSDHVIHVAVVEGIVQISSERADRRVGRARTQQVRTRVPAGEGVNIVSTGEVSIPAPINPADVGAWQQRRLVFSDNTLAEIAEEFSRYNRTPRVRVEGDALRARRISGVFDADSPEALLIYLASDRTLAFDRQGDDFIVRLRPVIVQSDVNEQ